MVASTDKDYLSDLSWQRLSHLVLHQEIVFSTKPAPPIACCSPSRSCLPCTSDPACLHVLRVLRRTPGTRTPDPICHPPTVQAARVAPQWACARPGLKSGHRPRGRSAARASVHVRVRPFLPFDRRICVALPQEELWAVSRKAIGDGFGKPLGKLRTKLSHPFVSITDAFGPGAVTEDQNRDFLQKEQQIQWRQSTTNPLLQSGAVTEVWGGFISGVVWHFKYIQLLLPIYIYITYFLWFMQ